MTSEATLVGRRPPPSRRRGPWRGPWPWIVTVLLVYLVVLLDISVHEYGSYNLSWDFGQAEQAWHLIAHGNLNPYDTLHQHAWWQDHGAFLIWLLAPLYWIAPNDGLTLLVVQDLAIVVAIAAAADWTILFSARRGAAPIITNVCVGTLIALCVFNVGLYATVLYDFHDQVLGTAFLILTGRDVYAGRRRRALLWGALTLLSMDLSALNLAALGVGLALIERRLRRAGALMALAGVAWYLGIGLAGGSRGTTLAYYDRIAGRHLTGGLGDYGAIARGALRHPTRVLHQLNAYRYPLYEDLVPSGILGLAEPSVVLAILAVIIPGAVSSYGGFIKLGFQNTPAYLLAAVGSSLVLARVASPPRQPAPEPSTPVTGGRQPRSRTALVVVLAAVTTSFGLACDATVAARGGEIDFSVSAAAAQQLAVVRRLTPSGSEVAVPFGVIGRFSGRRYAYLIHDLPWKLPVATRVVEVIFAPHAGNEWLPGAKIDAAETALVRLYRAKVLFAGTQAQAYEVTSIAPGGSITLP